MASNFDVNENNLAKLVHMVCHDAGMKIWVHIFGGLHPKNFAGAISKNFRLIANISGTD